MLASPLKLRKDERVEAVSVAGGRIATVSEGDSPMSLYDLSGKLIARPPMLVSDVSRAWRPAQVQFSRTGARLGCLAGDPRAFWFWEAATGKFQDRLKIPDENAWRDSWINSAYEHLPTATLTFVDDDYVLGHDGLTMELQGHASRVLNPLVSVETIAVAPGRRYLATTCDNTISIWRISEDAGYRGRLAQVVRRFCCRPD